MATQVFGTDVAQVIQAAQTASMPGGAGQITLGGQPFNLPAPFPSPLDWRDCTIYFLMLDRFNNPAAPPAQPWNVPTTSRQGGTFAGVTAQLPYIQALGAKAIWLSPVLKNPWSENANMTYPGYATQDFINLDRRFASDQTLPTAEIEFRKLVDTAHGLGLYVIQDIVINHSARVFDYFIGGATQSAPGWLNLPLGQQPPVQWLNGYAQPLGNWQNASPVPGAGVDDAVWPVELQQPLFYRREGNRASDTIGAQGFVPGDFGTMRQHCAEYDATVPGQEAIRAQYGAFPVLSILARCYQYLIAKYDLDGFRIDTVKYVRPDIVENFCNAMRETALSLGKKNFFTFGEIWDSDTNIDSFVGRHSSEIDSGGLDAALDYPLFYNLPGAVKGFNDVATLWQMFQARNAAEENIVSSHAEVGRYFVSFIDNHDQNQRFNAPGTFATQVTQALACLYTLQGIPCLYYGTEQGLTGLPSLNALECTREPLWGVQPAPAFDPTNSFYTDIQKIIALRNSTPALRYGRLYFRELSSQNNVFGQGFGPGGVIAFSRVLSDAEVVTVANTSTTKTFTGFVLVDLDINRATPTYSVAYSNLGTAGSGPAQIVQGQVTDGPSPGTVTSVACLYVVLQPMEVQVLAV
jgi:glycosidase